MTATSASEPAAIRQIIPTGNPIRLLFSLEPLKSFVFLILSFVIGLALFVTFITLFTTGISLTLTVIMAVIGIPLLALMMVIVPFAGHIERARISSFSGIEIGNPYRPLPEEKFGDKALSFLSDGALWRDFLYACLLFPIGLFQFVIAVVGASVPFALIMTPYIVHRFGPGSVDGPPFYTVNNTVDTIPLVVIGIILGVVAIYTFVILMRAHAVFARWLIGPSDRDELVARVETLSETRSRMVGVSLEDRRSIERDIHDSTQPKLVALAMNLGMAKEKIESDPVQARELVESAHKNARDVLSEIRNLVRGLHPSILTDRGLEAAIRSLAGYCSVPVNIDVELDERPAEDVETTAYYIISEALTNVAKHSQATEAHVMVRMSDGVLTLSVEDDGIGGAAPAAASGLAGLQDRAAALDGTLTIRSPQGGPTKVSARIPCAS
jgi:signal transduction histidine kinase